MGLVAGSSEHQKLHARRVVDEAVPLAPGHKRGQTADRTDRNLRGVPVIGHGSGAIRGSSPGGDMRFINVERVVLSPDQRTQLVVQWRMRQARIDLRCPDLPARSR